MAKEYLQVVPDDQTMTREFFANLIRKYRHHRSISYGFSVKHTKDIMAYRKSVGVDGSTIPDSLYGMPVRYNEPCTYVK